MQGYRTRVVGKEVLLLGMKLRNEGIGDAPPTMRKYKKIRYQVLYIIVYVATLYRKCGNVSKRRTLFDKEQAGDITKLAK